MAIAASSYTTRNVIMKGAQGLKALAYARGWRERHPGYMAERCRIWRSAHPEKVVQDRERKRLLRRKRAMVRNGIVANNMEGMNE
jgi:hypothetical protein